MNVRKPLFISSVRGAKIFAVAGSARLKIFAVTGTPRLGGSGLEAPERDSDDDNESNDDSTDSGRFSFSISLRISSSRLSTTTVSFVSTLFFATFVGILKLLYALLLLLLVLFFNV